MSDQYQTGGYKKKENKKSGCWIVLLIMGLIFAGFVVLVLGFFFLISSPFKSKPVAVKSNSVLHLQVPGIINEYTATDPFGLIIQSKKPVKYLDILNAIERAKTDDRIRGIYFRNSDLRGGFSKSMELWQALKEFKQTDKFIISFMEIGSEMDYFMAAVSDSIFMPPEAFIELNGFAIYDIFLKNTFNKIGIDFYVEQYEEYKSAGEPYTRTGFSQPARQSIQDLLDHRISVYVRTIADARSVSSEKINRLLNEGIYDSQSMLDNKLVDAILPEYKVKRILEEKSQGKELETIKLADYVQTQSPIKSNTVVRDKELALIIASGVMMMGDTGDIGPFEESMLASKSFARYLKKARENDKIKAIILRIDSPGGSVLAASDMWQQIKKTAAVKPVIASMGDVAASGGYYIATACQSIIAHPATVTGSIGVISIIPNFSPLLDKLGADVDTVKTHDSSLFLNPLLPFRAEDKQTFSKLSRDTYFRFIDKVAQSRDKSFKEARKIAKGRIWTGEMAYKVGLVDTLGGLKESIDMAKNLINVPKEKKVKLHIYPEPQDSFAALLNLINSLQTPKYEALGNKQSMLFPHYALLPVQLQEQVVYLYKLMKIAKTEPVVMALPFKPVSD